MKILNQIFFWDGNKLPFQDNDFDTVLCTEVLEHVSDTETFLKEMNRVLKPGGTFFFTTPFLWPLHDVPFDEKRLTPFGLSSYFKKSGFLSSDIKAMGGWHASMALMIGLWLRRAGMRYLLRLLLSFLLKPLVFFLFSKDSPPSQFGNGQMITGLYGLAKKS